MREIKFRAWIDGEMISADDLAFEEYAPLSDLLNNKEINLMQYTGLKDRNGKEIYEGDIITYQYDNDDCPFPNKNTTRRKGRVFWQDFRSCFVVTGGRNGSSALNQDLWKYVQNGNRVEVIGNIYESPELIRTR